LLQFEGTFTHFLFEDLDSDLEVEGAANAFEADYECGGLPLRYRKV
jgi:hypothetical protein